MNNMTFAHVALTCSDMKSTERFYAKHFGFQRARVIPIDNGEIVFLKSEKGDLYLELFPSNEKRPIPAVMKDGPEYPAFRHLAFKVDNVDEYIKDMGDDCHVTLGPFSFDEVIQGWRTVWLKDPDDRIIEISQGYVDQKNPPQT